MAQGEGIYQVQVFELKDEESQQIKAEEHNPQGTRFLMYYTSLQINLWSDFPYNLASRLCWSQEGVVAAMKTKDVANADIYEKEHPPVKQMHVALYRSFELLPESLVLGEHRP